MEDIEAELEAKSIERDIEIKEVIEPEKPEPQALASQALQGEPEPQALASQAQQGEPVAVAEPPKKTKRVRSQKQIEAFEKARAKRAEAIANRKKQKEELKEQKKEEKKELKKSKDIPVIQEQSIPQPVVQPTPQREQVIQNHYYYYGVPPPNHDTYTTKKKKKSKRPPTPSSSESESEEEIYQEVSEASQRSPQQQYYPMGRSQSDTYQPPPKPTYKFNYA